MDFSPLFTQDASFAFLNAGSLSRSPLFVLKKMQERRLEEERNPTYAVYRGPGQLWEAQTALAQFLGAQAENLFLRSNITLAMSDFIFALELAGEFLQTDVEYGAISQCFRARAEQLGCPWRQCHIPIGKNVREADLVQAVVSAFSDKTKVLLLSHIVTGTGVLMPVAEITREARKRGILVLVDGAHAVGALPLELEKLGVDFYGGNLHKWFCAPKGTAFGWVRPGLPLKWKFGGWATFGKLAHYEQFLGSEEAARRAYSGTMDLTPFEMIPVLVEFWQKHGPELRARQKELLDLAASQAHKMGWERITPEGAVPLASFRLPKSWPQMPPVDLVKKIFHEAKVQLALPVVQGETMVRLSPPAYSSESEVLQGMERLARFHA